MHTSFLSCDWGTSSFRLRLIDIAAGKPVAESLSDEGIKWTNDAWLSEGHKEDVRIRYYFSVIHRHIKMIKRKVKNMEPGIPIIISGMASANIGMMELPYTILPFATSGEDLEIKKIGDQDFFGHELQLVSGARTKTDVMRGEETQLTGCGGNDKKGMQLFIFTGTHSKHVIVESGKATDLKTYMTGELFTLLREHSVLAASVVPYSGEGDEEENNAAFEQGVKNGAGNNLLNALFRVRTNQLLRRFSREANYHYLSGLLIGSELADAATAIKIETLTLVGEERLMVNYLKALKILAVAAGIKTVDAAKATVDGHLKIYKRLYL